MLPPPRQDVPLAPLTTLGLGGPARYFVEATSETEVLAALGWADERGVPVFILGAGSNLVVPDAGWDGLVVRMALRGVSFSDESTAVLAHVAAGESWDDFVTAAVARELGGIECLAGIPGTAGATPVQNVGAYGQEVAETIARVRVFDRRGGAVAELAPEACGFAYRDSVFKREPGRFVVLGVSYRLGRATAPQIRYAELRAAVASDNPPTLARVRAAVLSLRRRKSMVLDPADANRRSVGSFFTNPVLTPAELDALVARARAAGVVADPAEVPRFSAGAEFKIPAAWLIEKAGFSKGTRRGPVGLSTAHALALVHHGGGRTADLLGFAREIRAGVAARFGVTLTPEPVVLGAGADPLA
jgi:UDP-N-acetylmuramate dehydrogenase